MDGLWAMETHGDPLSALRRIIGEVWQEAGLDGWIASSDAVNGDGQENRAEQESEYVSGAGFWIFDHPSQLSQINPFRPVMRANLARFLPGILRERPSARFGALLRPCEMRALHALESLDPFPRERLITLCVDCLGTYPASELQWRAGRKAKPGDLSGGVLQFASQGGVAVYRFRAACQVCPSPKAEGADINIGVLGLPARQHILMHAPQAGLAGQFSYTNLPLAEASPDLVDRRERVAGRVAARNSLTRERIVASLADRIPAHIDALAQQLEACGDCWKCMDACPIWSARRFTRRADGRYDRQEIARWLVSCAGCGMCEQACEKNLPLSAIFGVIREQLRAGEINLALPGSPHSL